MKNAKKMLLVAVMIVCVLTLTGCSKYNSRYKAVGFVHSNTSGSAYMNFAEFEGKMAFTLKKGSAGQMKATAKLESGSATVYYYDGTETQLFVVNAGDELETTVTSLQNGTVEILVQTSEKCLNGDFHFDME